MDKEEIKTGIVAYEKEQQTLLRLIRKTGGLTESKFDRIFRMREFKRPMKLRSISGDSFILGHGANGCSEWSWYLDLLQHMMSIDLVDTTQTKDNEIMYILPPKWRVTSSIKDKIKRKFKI